MVFLGTGQSACKGPASGQITGTTVSVMNNHGVISKADPIQLADEVGPIEDRHNPTGLDDSLPRGLDGSDEKKRAENRYHKRSRLNGYAFALIRSITAGPLKIDDRSMGCIACAVFNAKPAKLGIIDNISMGGLGFQYVDNKIQLNNAFVLDILLAECGLYLADLPFKIISDFAVSRDFPGDPIEMRQVRLQFQKLNAKQQAKLKDLIFNHSAETVEISANEQVIFTQIPST